MAPLRPEGLSPCFSSLVSPDIDESYCFRWTFRSDNSTDTQSKAEICIYEPDGNGNPSLVHTFTSLGSNQEISISGIGYSFVPGNTYWWDVTTYNQNNAASPVSEKAKFVYDHVPAATPITWTSFPSPNDVITKGVVFTELRDNLSNLLRDYQDADIRLINDVSALFSGEIVPDRGDFNTIEKALTFVAESNEGVSKLDVIQLIMDALGVSDLDKIRSFIDLLAHIPPKPVERVSIQVPAVTMYKPFNFKVLSSGQEDKSVNLIWDVEPIPKSEGTISLDLLSPSADIRYYDCELEYGTSNSPYVSRLFYRPEDFVQLRESIVFDANWSGLFTADTISSAKHTFRITAVDQRGNRSTTYSQTKVYGPNFKVPLGVSYYEVQYQKAPYSDTDGPDLSGLWHTLYKGKNQSTVHYITGGTGKYYYRVRAVDVSGLVSDWVYGNSGVLFDPLKPPGPVQNFRSDPKTTSVNLYWDPVFTAEHYEIKIGSNGSIFYNGSGTDTTKYDLSPNTQYTFYIRAVNRAGDGPWTSLVTKTKSPRTTTQWKATLGKSWRDKYGGWRDDNDVIQGEWVELESHYVDGRWVEKGHTWGKHKGLWFFDSADIRSKLQGKSIVKIRLFIKRLGTKHGYYYDQLPTYWLHNYTGPSGVDQPYPVSGTKYVHPPKFAIGDSGWVDLPNYYGEYLRDNRAKGIMIWVDKWGQSPYLRFDDGAILEITYE